MAKETPEEIIARLEKEKADALALLEKANLKLSATERAQKAGVQSIAVKGEKEACVALVKQFILPGDETKTVHKVEELEKDSELVKKVNDIKGHRIYLKLKDYEVEKELANKRKDSRVAKKKQAKAETEE